MRCERTAYLRTALRLWYKKLPGAWLMEEEQRILNQILPTLFGYHLLQVGVISEADCLYTSRIPHRVVMDIDRQCRADSKESSSAISYIQGAPEAIPMASDTLDVLVLTHTLEFSQDPHQVLREVDRILIPEGHVVVLGFNPWGMWMPWRLMLGLRQRPPWCGRFIGLPRLRDWLQLLGFDVVHTHGYFFRPPFKHQRLMHRLRFLDRLDQR